jgi:hypothetical protein
MQHQNAYPDQEHLLGSFDAAAESSAAEKRGIHSIILSSPLWLTQNRRVPIRRYVVVIATAAFVVVILMQSALSLPPQEDNISHRDKLSGGNIGQFATMPAASILRHRRHPRARSMRIHFLNHHFGTTSEMQAVTRAISKRNRVHIDLKETRGIYDMVGDLYIPKNESDVYWAQEAQKTECNPKKFDMLIVGDTMSLIRPHLQNCCPLKMVSLLTTRFDWAHDDDYAWRNLLVNASRWSNFRVHPNNLIESWFADWKDSDIKMLDYLPSSGIPSDLWKEALNSANKTSPPNDNELIIPRSVRQDVCLTNHLDERNISFTDYGRNQYGGPLGLTDKIMVHFPYQSNTMSLFENLHQRVIYVLPTLRLYREMGLVCEARLEMIPSYLLSDQDFYKRVDWWRTDLQHLFFYFDSFDDLKEGSTFRRQIVAQAKKKRSIIADYMLRQQEYVLEQWEEIFFGQWPNEGHADSQCKAYRQKTDAQDILDEKDALLRARPKLILDE